MTCQVSQVCHENDYLENYHIVQQSMLTIPTRVYVGNLVSISCSPSSDSVVKIDLHSKFMIKIRIASWTFFQFSYDNQSACVPIRKMNTKGPPQTFIKSIINYVQGCKIIPSLLNTISLLSVFLMSVLTFRGKSEILCA